ncbi:hypothetical protein O181_108157 [Austropuccinia psidii MF-1]|uniref:Uncharacterized protein n=1 Tax=Austropuccinia psidii MF-1 TaxID=1389203 RepID=A0A9Q3JVD6_9BASI|nr:hypothetical protein [Austropuccinia psidii MF-1]
MVINKGLNTNRKFTLLEEMEARRKENQAPIQAIEEKMNQTENTLIPSGSQGLKQPDTPVDLKHSRTSRLVAKSHHYSKLKVVFSRRQG